MNFFSKIKDGLTKTSSKLSEGINNIFSKSRLDDSSLEELEELLILSDMSYETSQKIIAEFSKEKFEQQVSPEIVKKSLAAKIEKIIETAEYAKYEYEHKPVVIMVCGVNGNGKTTSLGKLAHFFQKDSKKVLIAACDTFRAAATSQLKIWGERNKVDVITGDDNSDPASVAFRAYDMARNNKIDILLIDTAGRLQNKSNLMEELAKICRVIKKIDEQAPHEIILVLDATTGQNAHSQLQTFKEYVNVSSLIITKLDGTAKAGVVVSLIDKFKLPIYAIGVGEKIDDLQKFSAKDFANNLLGI